ncbi:MAG: type II toxin-antitoxin system RelE/ParE family toxin [Ignavibacteria bacterium]|nr:MAG: type II toxin-antitoxin system RelE/ParE family toxin [Ignavibacteria bacterium]
MAKYNIEIKKSAAKEIKKLPAKNINGVIKILDELAGNPRPEGCLKLSNNEKYRIRFGVYTLLYEIYDDRLLIIVVKVAHRKDVYRYN